MQLLPNQCILFWSGEWVYKPNEKRFENTTVFEVIKFDVTWSYVNPQTAKMKLLPSVFSSLNSRVKRFVFVENSRRHFSIFM